MKRLLRWMLLLSLLAALLIIAGSWIGAEQLIPAPGRESERARG